MKLIEGYEAAKKILSRHNVAAYGNVSPAVIARLKEIFGREISPEQAVAQILEDVRTKGDAAIREYTLKIDGIKTGELEVSKAEIRAAYNDVTKELVTALEIAGDRVQQFHQEQKNSVWCGVSGREWDQLIRPLQSVGFYVPGGTASYPSTVIATVIPAKTAGVKEAIITTPPKADGKIPPMTLVAADIAGADHIYRVGGAQAIAALAYGTETIQRVDKICGPGNVFVMLAKKQVFGTVGIDALQGPSEVLIIADDKAKPVYCAADILAQAEHDTLARAVLVTTSRKTAEDVLREIAQQLEKITRNRIAVEALDKNGVIAIVANITEAIELANLFAPEHLELLVENASKYVTKIKNAGCIFVGEYSTEPIGDYVAGPSHALPTGGTARFSSPLNILDFIKITDVVKVNKSNLKKIGEAAVTIAKAEGLDAHAEAVKKRLNNIYGK